MAAELGERCRFSTWVSGMPGACWGNPPGGSGYQRPMGYSLSPPSLLPWADSRRHFSFSSLCLVPFPSPVPGHCALSPEQLVSVATACMVRQTPILLPLPSTSSARKAVLACCWTIRHHLCCCCSLSGSVHSLSDAQMDRSLRCPGILCRGAFFSSFGYGCPISCKAKRREKVND